MDYMLDPPEDDQFDCLDYELDNVVEFYDIDEVSANASSQWQNDRNF
jgi:hypothetical protein